MSTASPTPSPESVLLVQCCHLPQFFYLAEKLRQRNPEWILSALVTDRPHVRFYLELFPPFDHLFFFDKKLPEMPGAFDQILFPLLNRGYLRIKRAARQLPGIAYEIDYQGERRALKLGTLVRSFAAPLHRPSEEFVQYLEDFPHRPLGEKVLVVETCHRSLADSSEEKWGRLIPDQAEVTRISASTEGRGWRTLRRQSFDSGVVFFSGEKGFAKLKLLPFLLGVPKILVVNENGNYFYATYRSLLRFLWGRVWQGAPLPKPSPRILVIQTESPTYVRRAIEVLRKPEMFPRSRICLLCRKEDADRFRNVSGLESVLTYSRRKVGSNVGLWRDLKGFDAVAAVFSGRGVFRKQKLLYFLLPIRHHLAFNARSDCYRLTPRTLFWTLRKDPSFFAAEKQPDSPILFLLTDEDSRARKAIEKASRPQGSLPSTHLGLLSRGQALFLPGPARGRGGSDLCSRADLGKPEGGSGPGPLPSRSRLLDLLSPPCFPAAETAICAPAGETSTGLQPGGSQLLLSEGQSRSQRPAFSLGNVAPRAAHAKPAWRPPHVVFPHCGRFQSCRGHRKASRPQGCR